MTIGPITPDLTATRGVGAVERLRDTLRPEVLFYPGLLGLFAVAITIWAALWVVIPSVLSGWTSVAITSDSMAPSIRRGDIVVAAPYEGGAGVGPGAVIVFHDPDGHGLLTHRVAALYPDGSYLTRGDANQGPDSSPVGPAQVVGVGRVLVPLFGLPMVWVLQGEWLNISVLVLMFMGALSLSRHAFTEPALA